MPGLLKSVRTLVDADSAGFFWVDSNGDMTRLYTERLLPAPVMQFYFARYFQKLDAHDRPQMVARVLGKSG